MNFSASSGRIRKRPSGLLISEAIFARNLFTEIPAEAVRPVLCFISFLILFAMTVADPIFFLSSVTSRNASSIESGSIISVYSLKISNTLAETSLYLSKLCFTNIRSGHNRLAMTDGIADLTPNFLCFITGCSHNTPLTAPSYCNRFASQFRIVKLFNRCKKSIHVDMNNLSQNI